MTDNTARRPRWPVFVSLAVLLILVALVLPVFRQTPSSASRARFDRIQNGMTEDQVERLLGGTRGVYDKGRPGTTTTAVGIGPGMGHLSWWYFPDCVIEVEFDEYGRVCHKMIEPPPPQSIAGKFAWWCERTFPSPRP